MQDLTPAAVTPAADPSRELAGVLERVEEAVACGAGLDRRADALVVAEARAGGDDDARAMEARGELVAVDAVAAQPEDVGLRVRRVVAQLAHRGQEPRALLAHDRDVALDRAPVAQRLEHAGLG